MLFSDNYRITDALQGLMQRTKNVKNNVKNFMFNGNAALPPENLIESNPDNVIEPSFSNIIPKNDLCMNNTTGEKNIASKNSSNECSHNYSRDKIDGGDSTHSNNLGNPKSSIDAEHSIPVNEANQFVDEFIERYILDISSGEEPKIRHASTSYDDFSLSDLPHDIALGIHERLVLFNNTKADGTS